jgi:polar amino acid transport system substrate-binding protein
MAMINRRIVLAALVAPFLVQSASAQSPATLDQLKQAGAVKVGLVNQPPYSALNPDGTIGGFVPTLVQEIMSRLGVERIEPSVATYGELIPGLQAGRWQIIAASFRLTPERCSQVLFADPVTFDGGAIAYVAKDGEQAPTSITDLVDGDEPIGVLQGSYLVELVTGLGIAESRLSQFPSNPALIDGMQAGRVGTVISTNAALEQLREQRGGGYEIAYPLSEDPPVGSAPAFSTADVELHAAFQKELRAMREIGELQKMAEQFGFGAPPEELMGISAEDACARL